MPQGLGAMIEGREGEGQKVRQRAGRTASTCRFICHSYSIELLLFVQIFNFHGNTSWKEIPLPKNN
jgi:hypothetical protein